MTIENGKTLPQKSRWPNIFRRKTIDELRKEIKEELGKEPFLDSYVRVLDFQAEKLLRIPYFLCGVKNTAEDVQYAEDISKNFYGDGFESPVRCVLGVGSLFSRKIGNIDGLGSFRENLQKLSEEDIYNSFYDVLSKDSDFDGFLIVRDMPEEAKKVTQNAFVRVLPKMPASLTENFGGYEFHEDCLKTESDFQKLIDSFESFPESPLKTHEREILDKSSNKRVVPVVAYESTKLSPGLKLKIDELAASGRVVDCQAYLSQTWRPYAKIFKYERPEKYKEIIESTLGEAGKSSIRASDFNFIAGTYNI